VYSADSPRKEEVFLQDEVDASSQSA
jgi:hypothetical protein